MKVCPSCGKEMPDEYGFCTTCGHEMKDGKDPAPEVTAEQNAAPAGDEPAAEEVPAAADAVKEPEEAAPEAETAEAAAPEIEPAAEAAAPEAEAAEAAAPEAVAEEAAPAGVALSKEPSAVAGQGGTANNWSASAAAPQPSPAKSGNGKKAGLIAGVIALVAVAGITATAVMKSDNNKDPKETVIEAFKSVYEGEKVSHLDDIFGFTQMYETATTTSTEGSMAVKFDGSNMYYMEELIGSGFELQGKNDFENKKSSAMIGVQYQGMDLAHADIYLDEYEIMLAVPELSSKVFKLNYADDLQGQIEKSPYLGEYIKDMDFDMDAISEYIDYAYAIDNGEEGTPFDIPALWERYKTGSQAIENLKAAMTVEKGDKAIRTVDGKEENCRTFKAVIPGESVIEFFRTTSDFFMDDEQLRTDIMEYLTQAFKLSESMNPYSYSYYGENPETITDELYQNAEKSFDEFLDELEDILQDDIRMTVYVDSKGRLAALEAETELTSDEEVINAEFTAALKGGDYLTQNAEVELHMFDDEHELILSMDKSGSYDGKLLLSDVKISLTMDDEEYSGSYSGSYKTDDKTYELELLVDANYNSAKFTMEGVVTELEKGVSLETTVESLRIEVDGEYIELSGSYAFGPLDGEVTVPDGTQMDILAATESDWEAVGMEIFMKVMELSSKLQ